MKPTPKDNTTEFLKRRAKILAKQAGLRHHSALDKIVQDEQGCANWQHYLRTRKSHAHSGTTNTNIPDPFNEFRNLVTTKEEAARLLRRAKQQIPNLTLSGIGIIAKDQEALEDRLYEIAICADWAKQIDQINSLNRRQTSYSYKHSVEHWCQSRIGTGESVPHYVANGSFIAAAVGLGFKFAQIGPNAFFNFSERALNRDLPPVRAVGTRHFEVPGFSGKTRSESI